MERLTYTRLKRQIEQEAKDNPLSIEDFEVSLNGKNTSKEMQYLRDEWKQRHSSRVENKAYMYRYRIVYAVIHGGIYDKAFVKGMYVPDSLIEQVYSKYARYTNFLKNIECYGDFVEHVHVLAKRAYETECQKADYFEANSTLLDKLITLPPKIWTLRHLSKTVNQLNDVNTDLILLEQKKSKGLISDRDFRNEHVSLRRLKNRLRSTYIFELNRRETKRDTASEKNFSMMKAANIDILSGEHKSAYYLNYGTVTDCRFLLKVYVSWYNNRYSEEIGESNRIVRNTKERKKYAEKNAEKRAAKSEEHRQEIQQVMGCLSRGIHTLEAIHQATGLTKYKIRKAKKKLEMIISTLD